jgi:hypothetical protein
VLSLSVEAEGTTTTTISIDLNIISSHISRCMAAAAIELVAHYCSVLLVYTFYSDSTIVMRYTHGLI